MVVDETRLVTTYCPRCDGSMVWAARELDGDAVSLDISDWACDCELTDEEWAALTQQAAAALDGMGREAATRRAWAVDVGGVLAAQCAGAPPQ